jgi:hypothetical protein
MSRPTRRESHFLELIYPEGTIGIGTRIGEALWQRGLVTIAKWGRYGITPAGIEALEQDDEL